MFIPKVVLGEKGGQQTDAETEGTKGLFHVVGPGAIPAENRDGPQQQMKMQEFKGETK